LGGTFHAILTRETLGRYGRPSDNFHLLMHVERIAKLSELRYALTRWFPEIGEADVRRAQQHVGYTRCGKIESAFGYITKVRTPQAAWPKWQYRRAGTVFGKRYKITANLRAKPLEHATPKPIKIEDYSIFSWSRARPGSGPCRPPRCLRQLHICITTCS
jgi:hypothetical protein